MDGRDADTRWWTSPRRLIRRLLALDDTPHSIALGTTIGMFVGMTPTVGIQMMVILAIAAVTRPLFHFNRVAGLIAVYISNPLTMLPMYAAFYYVGTLLVEAPMTPDEFLAQFEAALEQGWLDPLRFIFAEVAWPMLAGSLLIATVAAVPTYPIVKQLVIAKRRLLAGAETETETEPHQADTPDTESRAEPDPQS